MKPYSTVSTHRHRPVLTASLFVVVALTPFAQLHPTAIYVPYSDAEPILKQLDEILPADLKGKSPEQQSALWPNWVGRRDKEIRARLIQGDEDSIVNLLLFGTSYTRQLRLTPQQVSEIAHSEQLASGKLPKNARTEVLLARVDDLINGMALPANNERLLFARQVLLGQNGINPNTAAGRDEARRYLLISLNRVLSENAAYARVLEQARLGSATEEFAERSRLFKTRGLSSDTSLLPNFAIEQSLAAMANAKLLQPKSVQRIAIVGPGLDFTDKQEGYDFYPQQSIQPFAIIDSLLRLGLAQSNSLEVTTLDLSPRVNEHLRRARQDGLRGQGYTLQLPRDLHAGWKPEAVAYWSQFGNRIGVNERPIPVPSLTADVTTRAVRVRPEVVSRVMPVDLNIVLQRLELPESARFDLIIATNILLYYDVFEQTLGLRNVERMLRPGGFLLTNNALIEFPFIKMNSVGYLTVVYSDQANDGDHIVWYRHSP